MGVAAAEGMAAKSSFAGGAAASAPCFLGIAIRKVLRAAWFDGRPARGPEACNSPAPRSFCLPTLELLARCNGTVEATCCSPISHYHPARLFHTFFMFTLGCPSVSSAHEPPVEPRLLMKSQSTYGSLHSSPRSERVHPTCGWRHTPPPHTGTALPRLLPTAPFPNHSLPVDISTPTPTRHCPRCSLGSATVALHMPGCRGAGHAPSVSGSTAQLGSAHTSCCRCCRGYRSSSNICS